jgi:hypothetical protein
MIEAIATLSSPRSGAKGREATEMRSARRQFHHPILQNQYVM